MITPDHEWIAGDWGGTHLRLWHRRGQQEVLHQLHCAKGARELAAGAFANVLDEQLAQWQLPNVHELPVILCGMVGAQQGWHCTPYVDITHLQKGGLADWVAHCRNQAVSPRANTYIIAGLAQNQPANVMRGEETQLFGFLAQIPNYTGYVCLPGTHSKWVWVEEGRIDHFSTAMTGELFALLTTHSLLASCVALTDRVHGEVNPEEGAVFNDGVLEAYRHGQRSLHALFEIRARSLLQHTPPALARAYLSGWLIGLELAGLNELRDQSHTRITLIGASNLCVHYQRALACVMPHAPCQTYDGTQAVLAGLTLLHEAR